MYHLSQFICWRELPPITPGGKPRKVPHDPRTGHPCDPHDPSQWMSYETAKATGWPIGFVLTANDPYFLFDLDGCRNPTTGEWTAEAMAIAALFPGAAMEISVNGTGLHIVGRCDALALGPRRHKWGVANWLEWYCDKRFMALGHGFQGEFDLDWTTTLAALVPVDETDEGEVTFIDQAVPEWNGPANDDDLIDLMKASKGSSAVAFGDKASFSDLWNADPIALAKHFPSVNGDVFDRSAAELALMNSLAFYTGKNTARMDRLFRRSGLMRDKYAKRASIRHSAISRAVKGTRNVYARPRQELVHTDGTTEPVTTSDSREFITLNEQAEFFKGCVYVVDDHAVMIPGGKLLKPERFKALFGGHQFAMTYGGEKPTTDAFEVITQSRAMRFPKVHRTTFRPDLPSGHIHRDAVNVYFPEEIETTDGDVTPLLDLLRKQLPDPHDREVFLAWHAAMMQYPGKKFLWSPVMQGTKGNGKSLWNACMTYCVGEKYSWTIKPGKIANDFNAYLRNRMFINVEEMHMFSDKYEVMDTIKSLITDTTQEVTKKGIDSDVIRDYCANWSFCANPKDALVKERDDRRFAPFFTAQQSREDMIRDGMLKDHYFPKMWDWLRSGGYAAWRGYLMRHAIPDELNPATYCTLAPETSSTTEAVTSSYGVAEQYVFEAIEEGVAGFRGGWLSAWKVNELLSGRRINRGPRKIGEMIERMGYVKHGRMTTPILQEGNSRVMLYHLPGVTIDYEVAQGYRAANLQAVG